MLANKKPAAFLRGIWQLWDRRVCWQTLLSLDRHWCLEVSGQGAWTTYRAVIWVPYSASERGMGWEGKDIKTSLEITKIDLLSVRKWEMDLHFQCFGEIWEGWRHHQRFQVNHCVSFEFKVFSEYEIPQHGHLDPNFLEFHHMLDQTRVCQNPCPAFSSDQCLADQWESPQLL